ncbi:DUF4349 domain-containing protein [Demequina lutea]|uniref:DUF4349 domain-containing protein n=1 Tax=Demequina lutea TaxID=431489 RepID=A0A7Z0CL64_9MICO|nr:DUF4349 domain-containing protein [Demequina lutea]NYI42435.1 hypothetical protein [Demequina lutea]
MSNRGEGTMRRMRRIGVIAGLIVAAGALAGCSASADTSVANANAGNAAQVDTKVGDAAAAAPAAADRSLVVTGSLYITVEDPLAAADKAASIVQTAGGRVDARDETAPQGRDGGSASLTLRIPADDLDKVVDDLRALGTVDSYATQARDVTTEVTDLDAKISTLRASTDRIQGLLADAKDIKDIITLENELASRQAELQSLEAQQRGLHDQVSMSTIDLSLTTKPVVIADNSPQTFWDGLSSGWHGLVAFISVALVVIGALLPWAALGTVITIAVIAMVRARRRRAARRAEASPAPTPAPTTNPALWATQPGAPAPAAPQAPATPPAPAEKLAPEHPTPKPPAA